MKNYRLESTMTTYRQLLSVKVKEVGEPLVRVKQIPFQYINIMSDMKKIIGNNIIVRKSVYQKLLEAQKILINKNPRYSLLIMYGFRTLEIQTNRFIKRLSLLCKTYFANPIQLYEQVHRSVAVPEVAGHPTGGAIDICIIDNKTKKQIDFGSSAYDYSSKKYYVFSNQVTKKQTTSRVLLRSIMIKVGFAPYDGEWWHFSYGDREWAYYYKKPYAIYDQIALIPGYEKYLYKKPAFRSMRP